MMASGVVASSPVYSRSTSPAGRELFSAGKTAYVRFWTLEQCWLARNPGIGYRAVFFTCLFSESKYLLTLTLIFAFLLGLVMNAGSSGSLLQTIS